MKRGITNHGKTITKQNYKLLEKSLHNEREKFKHDGTQHHDRFNN